MGDDRPALKGTDTAHIQNDFRRRACRSTYTEEVQETAPGQR
ncbi:MAG: hypothetical protein QW338_03825 [Conexivisphaerales archaeon]